MRMLRPTSLCLLTTVLLGVSGCVELTGQRISWFYDSVKDELQVLIHYDGIHDSGSDQHGKGVEQIPKFVADGDVLLLDWPFHLQMADVRKVINDQDADPREKDWARLVASIETKPLGFYREPDGRIGAAQLVTIPKAKDFFRKLNDLVNREILDSPVSPGGPTFRTEKRIHAAAAKGHQWSQLDGHAIRVTVPVHADEWARVKGEFFKELVKEIVKAFGDEGRDADSHFLRQLFQAVASVPVSYIEEDDQVTFVAGRRNTPTTVRVHIRQKYEASLEKVLVDAVGVDLDETRTKALLEADGESSDRSATVLDWGPPEDRVRPLLAVAQGGDDHRKQTAIARLESWATQWNVEHGVPEAPQKMENIEDYLAAWNQWYGRMKQFPLYGDEDAGEDAGEDEEDVEQ